MLKEVMKARPHVGTITITSKKPILALSKQKMRIIEAYVG
jgi:hypothetical protein